MAQKLKIKITKQAVEALTSAFDWLIYHYEITNSHELLLCNHANDLRAWFAEMEVNKTKTIGFGDTTALAICQLWHDVPFKSMPPFEALHVQNLLNEIDKHRKTIKPINDLVMQHTNNTATAALHLIINKLEKGLKNENKTAILEAYEEARALDLELVDGKTFDKYDSLIGKCNDFLYQ